MRVVATLVSKGTFSLVLMDNGSFIILKNGQDHSYPRDVLEAVDMFRSLT